MTPLSLIREAPVRSPSWSLLWKITAAAAASTFAAVVLLAWHASRQPRFHEVTAILRVPPVIAANTEWMPAAEAVARRYALEAFPAWAAVNPDRVCPLMVEELAPYAIGTPLYDPWGGPYMILCRGSSIVVQSRGPDGLWATDDDLRSDR